MAPKKQRSYEKFWMGMPPWIILGAVIILVPIFVFWTLQNINKQKENMILVLLEKGAALIRSFEAGTRTGMMGMMGMRGGSFQLQRLLMETAQQSDIVYLLVTGTEGTILAHNDPDQIGNIYGRELDLERIINSENMGWRQIPGSENANTFEVFRRFMPTRGRPPGHHGRMMPRIFRGSPMHSGFDDGAPDSYIIFVGLDMKAVEAARKADTRHTVIMGMILLLIGVAGIFSLFLAQAYRSARTSLKRVQAFSDTVVENMPIGLLAIDVEGQIVAFNQTAESVFQLSADEVLGKKPDGTLPRELWSLVEKIEDDLGILTEEIDCPVSDRKKIPMDVSVSLLQGDDRTLLGYIILFRDLTEVQTLKREIERNQRLASLGRLAAGIAHEIRNPLSSIKGFATYFKERYQDVPEDRQTADIMIQEVERLNRVIGQLLEFARPVDIQKKASSLQAVIQHSLKIIEREAQAKKIRLHTNLPSDIESVNIDPDRMNQVLLNLYLNAIEAMENGGTLSVQISSDDGAQKITISDTGSGISKNNLIHVFDPYFTTKQSGTGLGLAIVHNIIEAHRGELRVESQEGLGTTVTILLPDEK
ncbi:ATP-binding protein [Thermodesulfobacteriota bacterium]